MHEVFDGSNLRLARIFHGYALDDVAQAVGKSRQYIHKLESGTTEPTDSLVQDLADALSVRSGFFFERNTSPISEEHVHFRKLVSTRATVKQVAIAKADMLRMAIDVVEEWVDLPKVNFREANNIASDDDIERIAEKCRADWGLGKGPISNMTRVAEHAGAVVTTFSGVSPQVDALSVRLRRPIIVRNEAKQSNCRMRFDIGHEMGHFILHVGQTTGDRISERQANRFASAFLLPQSMMRKHFPLPRRGRLDWNGLSEFKLTWKASKAAILYRAHQLDLIDEAQYRTGFITLKRTGEAIREREDHLVPDEAPDLIYSSLKILRDEAGIGMKDLAKNMNVSEPLLRTILNIRAAPESTARGNVIPFPKKESANIQQ